MNSDSRDRDEEWEPWVALGKVLAKVDPVVFDAMIAAMKRRIARLRAMRQPVISFVNLPS